MTDNNSINWEFAGLNAPKSDELSSQEEVKNNLDIELEEDEEDEEDDSSIDSTDIYAAQKAYKKKNPGTGVKNPTEEKKQQCPICKKYFKKLNTKHLELVHNMTLEELVNTDIEASKFFTISGYAEINSDYAKLRKLQEQQELAAREQFLKLQEKELQKQKELEELKKVEEKKAQGILFVKTEEAVNSILDEICEHSTHTRQDENFKDTPKRVAKAFYELLEGSINTEQKLDDALQAKFPSQYPGIVVQGNIETVSLCPHHMLPIKNKIHIAYMASDKVVGLSKLARVAEILSRRLVMQEDLTNDIANAILKRLNPKGVAVIVEAEHSCMTIRGAQQSHALTTTMVVEGCFKYDPNIKKEFLYHVESFRRKPGQ